MRFTKERQTETDIQTKREREREREIERETEINCCLYTPCKLTVREIEVGSEAD